MNFIPGFCIQSAYVLCIMEGINLKHLLFVPITAIFKQVRLSRALMSNFSYTAHAQKPRTLTARSKCMHVTIDIRGPFTNSPWGEFLMYSTVFLRDMNQ